MQIVIEIDEDTYRYMQSRCKYQNKGDKGLSKFEEVGVAIKNGTPLPKGHGRLIDANNKIEVDTGTTFDWIVGATTRKEYTIDYLIEKAGCEVPTIVEADTERSDEE